MKTQLLYKYKCFSLIFTFFFLTSIKKTIYEKTQNTKVHVYSVFAAIKKPKMTKGTCINLHSVFIDKRIRHKRDYL